MGFIIIKVTYPNKKKANKNIYHLLQKKLISSANSLSIKSTSCWSGKITQVNETMVLLNTKKENWKKIKSVIKKMHSYKVPCITKFNAKSNKEYENWIKRETKI